MRGELDKATNVGEQTSILVWANRVSEKWLPLLFFGYTLLATISTIGRPDFNAAVASFGVFFHKTFDAAQRKWYMYALAFCIFLDLVWLDVASGVKATIAADGLANQQIPRMIAVGCSTANLFLKCGLILFLYAYGMAGAHMAELATEKHTYAAVDTENSLAPVVSPRQAARAALAAVKH